MSNILVTGAGGQLGSELRVLAEAGSRRRYIFTDVAELDITDAAAVERFVAENDVEATVNCAAYTAVERAEEDEARADLLNNVAAGNLAAAMKRAGGTLVHISTDYVFAGDGDRPRREDDAAAPASAYGRTKLAGERTIAASGCKALILRTSWLYSSFGNNFVKTMLRLLDERESLDVVCDQTGSPTYAADLAGAIFRIVEEGLHAGNEGLYHYCGRGECTWYDFARAIAEESGHDGVRVRPCFSRDYPSRVRRPLYSVMDTGLFRERFGMEIPHWRESLVECLRRLGAVK